MSAAARSAAFRCRAFTADGEVVAMVVEAASPQAAVAAVVRRGLTPFETVAVTNAAAARPARLPARRERGDEAAAGIRLSLKELRAFTFETASLTRAGLPLDEAMRNMGTVEAKTTGARLARTLLRDVLEGAQWSDALARHPRTFSPEYRSVVQAGEMSGELPRVLGDLSALLDRRLEIRAKLVAALVYPAILLVMSLVSMGVIVAVLVPSLSPLFTDAGLPLPGILGLLVGLRDASGWIAGVCVLLGGGLTAVAVRSGRDAPWRHALDRLLTRAPLIGRFVMQRDAARFMRGLSTLIGAGVTLMTGLRIALDLVGNRELARRYREAVARIPQGEALNKVLGSDGLVSGAALRLVALGEETGRLAPTLAQAAGLIEGEQQQTVDRLMALLTPLVTVLVGGGIAALIMSVMGAVLSINDLAFR